MQSAVQYGENVQSAGADIAKACHWYCVYSKPCREDHVRFHLERQNIPVFMPVMRTRRKYRRKMRWQSVPLFPRYLFARFNFETTVTKVRSTRGVSSLVSFGMRPARVPEDIINLIRARCTEKQVVMDQADYRPGDRLTVVDGPYAGLSGIFERPTSARDRVVILLETMNTFAQVEIDRGYLKPELSS